MFGAFLILFEFKRAGVKLIVGSLLGYQIVVSAAHENPSVFEHHYNI